MNSISQHLRFGRSATDDLGFQQDFKMRKGSIRALVWVQQIGQSLAVENEVVRGFGSRHRRSLENKNVAGAIEIWKKGQKRIRAPGMVVCLSTVDWRLSGLRLL